MRTRPASSTDLAGHGSMPRPSRMSAALAVRPRLRQSGRKQGEGGMMRRFLWAAAAAAQPGQGQRPVRIGLSGPDMDACGGVAEVRGLAREGDNFLSVRARPSRVAPALDRLGTGRQVWICDEDAVTGWTGIVYA